MAKAKSADVAFTFLNTFFRLHGLRKKAEQYLRKGLKYPQDSVVDRIQSQWRCSMLLDETRRKLLRKMWETTKERLIKTYQVRGRKFASFVWKLQDITDEKVDRVIAAYYRKRKFKFVATFHKWMERKKSMAAVMESE